jgi:ferredoxin--NADP+ reductase
MPRGRSGYSAQMAGARNWRVAVVGAGPAGLYGAEALVKKGAEVHVFERLFAPHGLVRYGVAPDHQKIKKTTAVFDRILALPEVRLFANVNIGVDLTIEELKQCYDQVLITMGSSGARDLGIPGEQLEGSIAAPAFVGWYNGHPDFRDVLPPLDEPVAVIVGVGNVAIDVARILLRDPASLEPTDIAPQALEHLRKSRVREVILLARRGPDQAAFDIKEVRDLTELVAVEVRNVGLRAETSTDKGDFVAGLPHSELHGSTRRAVFRFCTSPREIIGNENGRVTQLRVEENDLFESASRLRAVGSGRTETLDTGLVIRAIGYRGTQLPGVPFEPASGTIPNEMGAVLSHPGGERIRQLYVAGWIKRGPTGLIGTNKADAVETVQVMEASLRHMGPERDVAEIDQLLEARGVSVIDHAAWQRLDSWEREAGASRARIRHKIATVEEALDILRR